MISVSKASRQYLICFGFVLVVFGNLVIRFWPDRLQRWFPNSSRLRNQHEESELVSLKIQDQH